MVEAERAAKSGKKGKAKKGKKGKKAKKGKDAKGKGKKKKDPTVCCVTGDAYAAIRTQYPMQFRARKQSFDSVAFW